MIFEELKNAYEKYSLPYDEIIVYTDFITDKSEFKMEILGGGEWFSKTFPSLVFNNSNYFIRIRNKKYFNWEYLEFFLFRKRKKIGGKVPQVVKNSFTSEGSYYCAYYTINFNLERSNDISMCLYNKDKMVLQTNIFKIV